MQSSSPRRRRRRPCSLDVDVDGGGGGGGGQRGTADVVVVPSSVDRLLNDIAFQRKRERQRAGGGRRRSRRRLQQRRDDQRTPQGSAVATDVHADVDADVDDEAASAYWWTDVFLRYFVFDDDRARADAAVAADSDDLLFFVRRVRDKRGTRQRQRRRRVAYDTRAYRKQQQQQKPATMLPIGDPAILWPHTVCLNAIVHRFRYTLTVAVCERVPRKSTAATVAVDCGHIDPEELELDDEQDQQYDLQLLSRHVHTVYASTSGRRMDSAKGPRERQVYPAVCWAVDDYAEAFRTVIVRPGQTVCAELVAAWPGATTVSDQQCDDNYYDRDDDDCDEPFHNHRSSAPVKLQQKQHRAVLFSGAVPYAAVRAAYECKMSLYREAERKRKRRKQQQRKRNGKKSSLGAALSASLTALFTGGKDSAASTDFGDCDYYYAGLASATAERVEYVTVRGCRPGRDEDDDSGGESLLDGGENPDRDLDSDNVSVKSSSCNDTKGLAQMAVTLAPVQRAEMATPSCDGAREFQHQNQFYTGEENHSDYNGYDVDGNNDLDCGVANNTAVVGYYDNVDGYTTPVGLHRQQIELSSSSYTAGTTTSEPGDYYDYGWDYETAASSEQQTPQTPSYHYQLQLQQQQQLERHVRRRNGRPRRLSDPCSTSVIDLLDDDEDGVVGPHYQRYQMQYTANNCNAKHLGDSRRKHQHYYRQKLQQQQLNGFGGTVAAVVTPGRAGIVHYPHRAWSESDGLDRCGGFTNQQKQQSPVLLPPPVPYYCAAEAAASGFLQYIHKSPGSWLARTKDLRKRRRSKSKKRTHRRQNSKTTATETRHRSSSAGSNGNINNDYCTTMNTTTASVGNVSENSDGSDTNSEDDGQNSDDQDSDGEFIGALAAAAALGHRSDSEWTYQGAVGDPVADWDGCDSDSNSDVDDGNTFEWTAEIISTDLRRKRPFQNWPTAAAAAAAAAAAPPRTIMLYNDFNWYGKPQTSTTPVAMNRHQQYQKPQQHNRAGQQNQRRQRPPPPQLQPQPLELPPPPPALSVAFTAVACPWWTVLEDMLLVSTTSDGASSNKNLAALPLLTFD